MTAVYNVIPIQLYYLLGIAFVFSLIIIGCALLGKWIDKKEGEQNKAKNRIKK